jgi:hypothetical protein
MYKPLADVEVEAFQWQGDPLGDYILPGWANALGLHTPTDNMLHVPCWNGTFAARAGDWVIRHPNGKVEVRPDDIFSAAYNVDDVEVEETRKTAEEKAAIAADAQAKVAEQKHEAAKARAADRESGGQASYVSPASPSKVEETPAEHAQKE